MSFSMENSDDSSLASDLPIPNEISISCFAFVPRRYYPLLSLVSKPFYGLISSPELSIARSLEKRTENVLYVALRLRLEETHCWYSLNPKPLKNESVFVPIPSFPCIPFWGSSTIAVGHEMYFIGGCVDGELTTNVFVVDCRFHTSRSLPSMRVARGCAATGVIDEKVYVIGGCKARSVDWIEVFDLKTKKWESVSGPCNEKLYEITIKSFVMNEKIYVMDRYDSYVYNPREKKWEVETVLNRGWSVGSCVINNMLYSIGVKNEINVYDPSTKVWCILKGVEDLREHPSGSRLANYGGKLAVVIDVGRRVLEISCTEIELEMRQGGEVWGKIVSSSCVLHLDVFSSTIVKCLTVSI